MSEHSFKFRQIAREDLLTILSEDMQRVDIAGTRFSDAKGSKHLPRDSVVAAFTEPDINNRSRLAGIYIRGEAARDFFAWVSTYLPFLCPITQICRVQITDDLEQFEQLPNSANRLRHSSAWAGAVAGECLAQLGSEPSAKETTLSAALATFSLPVARFHSLWANAMNFGRCLQALQRAVATPDGRDRRLSINDLKSVWIVLRSLERFKDGGLTRSEQMISRVCARIAESPVTGANIEEVIGDFLPVGSEFRDINNLTAEERLSLFDRVLDIYLSAPTQPEDKDIRAFSVSLAAWAVGLGDAKHIGLLWPAAEKSPLLLVWFCVLVGLNRHASRSEDWGGLLRLIDRELQYSYTPTDPPRADIGLLEYVTYQQPEFGGLLKKLRRAQVRSLSIELFPGVVFTRSVGVEPIISGQSQAADTGIRNADAAAIIEDAVSKLWLLRNEFIHGVRRPKAQSDLFGAEPLSSVARTRKRKREPEKR